MSNKILIVVAGWEERCLLGCANDISQFSPDIVLIVYSKEYASWTQQNRLLIKEICLNKNISVSDSSHSFCSPSENFATLNDELSKVFTNSHSEVRFNATTSPRDIIWSILHFLNTKSINTEFSYYRVGEYGEWLSRDADTPRLAMKRSGIMYPDLQTCLLVLSGYDDQRLGQLIRKFEPRKVLVGVQTGEQLQNRERNRPEISDFGVNIERFDFDCFDCSAEALQLLLDRINPLTDNYNLIAASLGPKPSALTLFRMTNINANIGLVYIPAKEYNKNYSRGIDLINTTLVKLQRHTI